MSTTMMGVRRLVVADAGELQVLARVDRGGIRVTEGELRYQLERKDAHPLARERELLDVLAELEDRGLITSELCFGLTACGRERLGELVAEGGRVAGWAA